MSDWTSGYVADVGYTHGYYHELNPVRMQLAFARHGLVFPKISTACELGFGQGLSANLHSAASATTWWGTDFNPSQAGFAQNMARATESGAHLFDEAFSEFCARTDLPDFDFIGLHGIWSWISDENRRVIVDFIRRKLRVGGVVYISYNTLPGWGAFAPIRHLMTEHAKVIGSEGRGIVHRINDAIEFTEQLLSTRPLYARANPSIVDRMKKLKEHNRQYLAHEYFNRDWHPMHFANVADWLEPAKLQYACSANFHDHTEALNLTDEQQVFLREIPDPLFRQTVRDFMVNQQFRKDYWIKGVRHMSPIEQSEAISEVHVALTTPRGEVILKAQGALGEAQLKESIYQPLLDELADHRPRTIGELEQSLKAKGVVRAQLLGAVSVLVGCGHLAPCHQETESIELGGAAFKANQWLIKRALGSSDISFLASPLTGGGVVVGRIQQLFLRALMDGKRSPSDWARSTWEILAAQGHRLVKDGQTLESAAANLAELNIRAEAFAARSVPVLRALRVLPEDR